MKPAKLQPGDQVRVVAPSKSLAIIEQPVREVALKRFNELGLAVTFSRHAEEMDEFGSSSIASRLQDLHEAFADPQVKAVFAVIGGFNSNQLLGYLDYDLIKRNPKILCGYSDTTALANAIYAKTGLITYSGPSFSSFGMEKGLSYTLDYVQKCLMADAAFEIEASSEWSDDPWYADQENRTFYPNQGFFPIQEGEVEGVIIGGNLCTLNLLQGTPYMPSLQDSILFLEDDYEVSPETFDRDLQSFIHQPQFAEVKAVVIGRFQTASRMTREKLQRIVQTKRELQHIPVVAEADFGHTTPFFTFPIGGRAKLSVTDKQVNLTIWP